MAASCGRTVWRRASRARLMGYPVLVLRGHAGHGGQRLCRSPSATSVPAYTIAERPDLRILRDPFSAKPNVLFYANKRVGGDITDLCGDQAAEDRGVLMILWPGPLAGPGHICRAKFATGPAAGGDLIMMLTEETPVPSLALPVEEMKDHLRMGSGFADDGLQDGLIEAYLRAALAAIEGRIGKMLFQRRFLVGAGVLAR